MQPGIDEGRSSQRSVGNSSNKDMKDLLVATLQSTYQTSPQPVQSVKN